MSRRMHLLSRRMCLFLLVCTCTGSLYAQDFEGIVVHGFVSQGFLFSSNNNYLSMKSTDGSPQWTDGAVSISDSLTDNLRVGIQLHMYQLGQFGGPNIQVDWASGDYRVNDYLGFRAGKVKTPLGLFKTIPKMWTPSSSGYCCRKALTRSTTKAFSWRILAVKCTALYPLAAAPESCTIAGMQDR